jgi:hypothetical protein
LFRFVIIAVARRAGTTNRRAPLPQPFLEHGRSKRPILEPASQFSAAAFLRLMGHYRVSARKDPQPASRIPQGEPRYQLQVVQQSSQTLLHHAQPTALS